jgi:hypothetical protein
LFRKTSKVISPLGRGDGFSVTVTGTATKIGTLGISEMVTLTVTLLLELDELDGGELELDELLLGTDEEELGPLELLEEGGGPLELDEDGGGPLLELPPEPDELLSVELDELKLELLLELAELDEEEIELLEELDEPEDDELKELDELDDEEAELLLELDELAEEEELLVGGGVSHFPVR